jgi:lipoate-protein ligase B
VDPDAQRHAPPIETRETRPIESHWHGRAGSRAVWELQKRLAAERAADAIPDQLLLVEHPAVLTLGRNADESHVRAPADALERRGIEVLRVERGGEVTYHGPGQLVAYPIVALSRRGLLLRPFVRALEAAMSATCAAYGVAADRRDGHPGCWVAGDGPAPRKIGALGIRIERGVSYHGIALNLDPDLADFDLIDACGMPGVLSTSIAAEAGRRGELATIGAVGAAGAIFAAAFAAEIGADLRTSAAASADLVPAPARRADLVATA